MNNILPYRIGNDLCSENAISFMAIEIFVVQLETFQFSKFYENVAKLGKGNFKKLDLDIQGQKFVKLLEKVA